MRACVHVRVLVCCVKQGDVEVRQEPPSRIDGSDGRTPHRPEEGSVQTLRRTITDAQGHRALQMGSEGERAPTSCHAPLVSPRPRFAWDTRPCDLGWLID